MKKILFLITGTAIIGILACNNRSGSTHDSLDKSPAQSGNQSGDNAQPTQDTSHYQQNTNAGPKQ